MVEDINELSGLIRTNPVTALCITLLVVSIAGLPPLAGFWPKLWILEAALAGHYLWLAIILVLSSVIAAAYYLRILKVMWFDEPSAPFEPTDPSVRLVLGVTALATIVFLIFIGSLNAATDVAAAGLLS